MMPSWCTWCISVAPSGETLSWPTGCLSSTLVGMIRSPDTADQCAERHAFFALTVVCVACRCPAGLNKWEQKGSGKYYYCHRLTEHCGEALFIQNKICWNFGLVFDRQTLCSIMTYQKSRLFCQRCVIGSPCLLGAVKRSVNFISWTFSGRKCISTWYC